VLTAGLGDTAQTFAWLSRALDVRDPLLVYNFVNDPKFEAFRRHGRGRELLRAMGLPQDR
jgi:hypothetical protein